MKSQLPEGHKRCSKCKQVLPLSEFYTYSSGRVFCYCYACKRDYQRNHRRRRLGIPLDAPVKSGIPAPVGATRLNKNGYVLVKVGADKTAHPRADKSGWVFQHLIVAEEKYGMPITFEYTIHHRNGDRSDNRPANLELRHGPHGKGADVLPYLLRDPENRALAAKILEEYECERGHDRV